MAEKWQRGLAEMGQLEAPKTKRKNNNQFIFIWSVIRGMSQKALSNLQLRSLLLFNKICMVILLGYFNKKRYLNIPFCTSKCWKMHLRACSEGPCNSYFQKLWKHCSRNLKWTAILFVEWYSDSAVLGVILFVHHVNVWINLNFEIRDDVVHEKLPYATLHGPENWSQP